MTYYWFLLIVLIKQSSDQSTYQSRDTLSIPNQSSKYYFKISFLPELLRSPGSDVFCTVLEDEKTKAIVRWGRGCGGGGGGTESGDWVLVWGLIDVFDFKVCLFSAYGQSRNECYRLPRGFPSRCRRHALVRWKFPGTEILRRFGTKNEASLKFSDFLHTFPLFNCKMVLEKVFFPLSKLVTLVDGFLQLWIDGFVCP